MPGLLDLLSQTWPARLAQDAWSAAKLPGEVYQGKIDPLSPEAISRANSLAGLMMGGSFAKAPAGALGSGPVRRAVFPITEQEINPNIKVEIGNLFRGTEAGTTKENALREFSNGDLGSGVYLTPSQQIAASYGGGPTASVKAGTRTVHDYETRGLYPEDVAYVFGGAKHGEDVRIVSGNGIELWRGPWSGNAIESALQNHSGIKAVIGTPNSIGVNQVSIRDPSIIKGGIK